MENRVKKQLKQQKLKQRRNTKVHAVMPHPVVEHKSWQKERCVSHPLAQDVATPVMLRVGNDGDVTDRKHKDIGKAYRVLEQEDDLGFAMKYYIRRFATDCPSKFLLSSFVVPADHVSESDQKSVTLQRTGRIRT